jgi:hypothetical protein
LNEILCCDGGRTLLARQQFRRLVPARVEWNNARMDAVPLSRPDVTQLLARGVTRMLLQHGLAPILEVPLANGRRADVMALTAQGEIWIVETKSCLADYACDEKWPDYLDYCDRFFFGVTEDFPRDRIPEDAGLIVADGFGGAILRDTEARPLNAARRKAVTLLFARLSAQRLAFL